MNTWSDSPLYSYSEEFNQLREFLGMHPKRIRVIEMIVETVLRAQMAAALADPDVDPAAKSLAGYLLGYGKGEEDA